ASRRRRKRGGAGCTNCAPTPISTFACRGISSAVNNTRLALTPGEPAGIGPDLALRLAGREQPCEVVAIADPQLLEQRAARLEVDVQLRRVDYDAAPRPQPAGTLLVDPVARAAPTMPGTPDPANARYVLNTLQRAVERCRTGACAALVTGP